MNQLNTGRFSAAFALFTLCCSISTAQVAHTGDLVGFVRGPGGVGLPGATVTARAAAGQPGVAAVTGESGTFRFDHLEPGTYTVKGEIHGFHPTSAAGVVIEESVVARVELSLSVATFHDTMQVDSQSPGDSIEASELRESAARDLGEALAGKTGVWKVRKGGIANDIVINGYSQDDVTVLIDGARVAGACPNRMDPPAFHLDFAEVARVDVESTSKRMSAQGSLGGIVNIVTKKPAPGFHADIALAAGNWDMVNPSATLSYGTEKFAVLGGISHRSSQPYADGSGTLFTDEANYLPSVDGVDAYNINSFWTRMYFEPAPGQELHLSYARQESDDVLYPALMMDASYDNTNRMVAGYRWDSDSGVLRAVRATAYVTQVDHWMVDSYRTTSASAPRGWSMGTQADTQVIGGTAEADLGPVTVGLEAYTRNWNAWTEMAGMGYARQYSIPDVDMDVLGLSLAWAKALSQTTQIEIGGRIDRVATTADPAKANTSMYFAYHGEVSTSRTDIEPSFSLRIAHQFKGRLSLAASLSRTVRSPDPRERYFGLRRMGGDWVGNPELNPPKANGAKIELDWHAAGAIVRASAWADKVDDNVLVYQQQRINMVPGVMNSSAQSYTNVDAFIRGISFDASIALSSRVFLSGGAAYVRGTLDPIPSLGIYSTNLPEMPPLTGRIAARWQNTRLFFEVEGVGSASQDEVDEDLNEATTPGWGIVNLKAGYSWNRWRVQTIFGNLFNRTYHEHFSYLRNPYRSGFIVNEPGRNLSVTVGWTL